MDNLINENILDPIQDELCKDIFDKELMKSKVKSAILDPIYKWLDKYGYPFDKHVKSVHLIGSSAGYQYTDTSDMDVSVETDIPAETVKKIWKELPNGNNLLETKHPINYYLTSSLKDVDDSDSAYNILDDVWLKKQNKEELGNKIPFSYVMEITKFFLSGVDDRIQEYNTDKTELEYLKKAGKDESSKEELDALIAQKENEIKADLDSLNVAHQMLKSFRKEAFENDDPTNVMIDVKINGKNGTINNMIYKMVEKMDYFKKFDEFEKLRKEIIDKK